MELSHTILYFLSLDPENHNIFNIYSFYILIFLWHVSLDKFSIHILANEIKIFLRYCFVISPPQTASGLRQFWSGNNSNFLVGCIYLLQCEGAYKPIQRFWIDIWYLQYPQIIFMNIITKSGPCLFTLSYFFFFVGKCVKCCISTFSFMGKSIVEYNFVPESQILVTSFDIHLLILNMDNLFW